MSAPNTPVSRDDASLVAAAPLSTGLDALREADRVCEASQTDDPQIVRSMAGETVWGFRVAAYRETHPEHGDKFGHRYSEHWSTPSQNPAVKVERLFTEDQLRSAIELRDIRSKDLMAWLGEQRSLELSFDYGDADDDGNDWCVHKVEGNTNDREWRLVGCGPTPLDAIRNARAYLVGQPSATQAKALGGDA